MIRHSKNASSYNPDVRSNESRAVVLSFSFSDVRTVLSQILGDICAHPGVICDFLNNTKGYVLTAWAYLSLIFRLSLPQETG